MGVGGATWAWAVGGAYAEWGWGAAETQDEDRSLDSLQNNIFLFCLCFILFFFSPKIFLQGEKTELHGKQQQQLVSVRACWQDWCSGPHR